MELLTCAHCGAEIASEGIRHRRRHFCSDECCEAFEDEFLARGGPDAEDLKDEGEVDDEFFTDEDDDFDAEDDDFEDDFDDDLAAADDDDDRY